MSGRYEDQRSHPHSSPLTFVFQFRQGHTKLPDYMPVGQFQKAPLRDLFTAASADCLNLLGKCLLYEPRRRINAKEVCGERFPEYSSYDSSDEFYLGSEPPVLLRASQSHSPFETTQTAVGAVVETVG